MLFRSNIKQPYPKIVIFGINGWVGKALLDYLFHRLKIAKNNLVLISSSSKKIKLIDNTEFDCITFDEALKLPDKNIYFFHLAFKLKDQLLTTDKNTFKKQNLTIQKKALKLIDHFNPNKMIYLSSGAVYNEDRTICNSYDKNPYGYLKAQDEILFNKLSKENNFTLLIPRIFNIAGNYINKFHIYAISDFILQAINNQQIIIKAKHPVIRSYIEIYDLINIITCWAFDQTSQNFTFDTANQDKIELSDLAHLIKNTLNLDIPIIRENFDNTAKSNSYVGNTENINILTKKYQIQLQPHTICINNIYNYLIKLNLCPSNN